MVDQAGAAVVGANVTVRNADSGLARQAVTDGAGAYRLLSLAPGEYEIKIEAAGFAPFRQNQFTLLVGQPAQFNVTLAPAGTTDAINVSAVAPAVDIAQTSASVSVDQERIEELPVTQRRFLNFALTAPGVVATGSQSRGGVRAGAVGARNLPDSGFSFGGLRPRSNNITIDGVDNNDETTGAGRAELSIEAIREFQVVNNGVSAEFGGSAGGSVNAVTRSGSNEFHGGAFLYTTHEAFNAGQPVFAINETPEIKQRFRRWQPGFDVGGPLRRDRSFFHATLEQEHESSADVSDLDDTLAARINAALAQGALPRSGTRRLQTGLFPASGDDTEGAFKLNHQLNETQSLMLRFAYTNDRRWRDALGAGSLSDFSARGDAFTRDQALVGQWLNVLNPAAVNDLRFQLARRRVLFRPNAAAGPQILIPGALTFGRVADAPSDRTEDHYQLLDSVALSRHRHQWRFGAGVNHVRLDARLAERANGFALFDSVTALLNAQPALYTQAFGAIETHPSVVTTGAFVQDHWQPRAGLTFDFGVRYDYEALPKPFARAARNFSPRIGFAFSPGASSRGVLRGAYGMYFDRYLLAFLNPALQRDGARGFEQVLSGAAAVAAFQQAQGGSLLAPVAGIAPSIYRADPRLRTPYSQQANLGFERQLFSDVTLAVNYLFVKGTHLPRTRNVNLLPPAALSGRVAFGAGRLDARYDAIWQLEDSAASRYHGLTASLGRKLTKQFGLQVSYTVSTTRDDASDFDEQPQNPYDLRAERARSRQDQRHRFVASGLFNPFGDDDDKPDDNASGWSKLVSGIAFAPLVTLASGRPFNPLTGGDDLHTLALPLTARPSGYARNSLSGVAQYNVDLRILKRFWLNERRQLLDFAVDIFNLTNAVNVRELSPFTGHGAQPLANFGKPLDALNARRLQFSLEFEF